MLSRNLSNISNLTFTGNGDLAFSSTGNANLDLFSSLSTMLTPRKEVVQRRIIPALFEDKNTFYKNLFFMRDIRNGSGLRSAFRYSLSILSETAPEGLIKILPFVSTYGRWDDLVFLLESPNKQVVDEVVKIISHQLNIDVSTNGSVSLLAKWLPSANASSSKTRKLGKILVKRLFDGNEAEYRKTLSYLRKKIGLLEQSMTNKDYSFDYNNLPAAALHKHTKAFLRNDGERYSHYIQSLIIPENKEKLGTKAKTLFPHEIVRKISNISEIPLANAMWEALPKPKITNRTLIVADLSGSMEITIPRTSIKISDVCKALTILGSEMLEGEFHNKFILFSRAPQFIELKGNTLKDKIIELNSKRHDALNTNIEAVYDLILKASQDVPESQRIDNILIISDMNFDRGTYNREISTFEAMKENFARAGVKLPYLTYWNLNSRDITYPTTELDNVALVSGFSANLFEQLVSGELLSAEKMMMNTLNKYSFIDDLFPKSIS